MHDTEKIQTESYGYRSIHYKHFPNGKLGLKIENAYLYDGLRKSWRDGSKQRVEDCLDSFIGGMINVAEALRQEQLERERRERERELERIRKEEERKKIEQESARIYDLNDRLNDMETAKAIREFTRMVRASAIERGEDLSAASELGKWLSWAETRAKLLTKNAIETIPELRKDPGQKNQWRY
ncbi:hypothetical protein KQI63_07015 [bacterium]|nr:hypothetical protein [bacterium]